LQTTKQIGDEAEDLAVDYLRGQGYEIIERNFRCSFGEVDIIALDGDALVFVEVKKKGSDRFGTPGEMITPKKLEKVRRSAQKYMADNILENADWRIDAVLINGERVELLKNITI
jgi:putative endonuclease